MIIILGTQKKRKKMRKDETACYNVFTSIKLSKEKEKNGLHGCEFVKRRSPQEILQIIHQYILNRENKIMYQRNAIFYL